MKNLNKKIMFAALFTVALFVFSLGSYGTVSLTDGASLIGSTSTVSVQYENNSTFSPGILIGVLSNQVTSYQNLLSYTSDSYTYSFTEINISQDGSTLPLYSIIVSSSSPEFTFGVGTLLLPYALNTTPTYSAAETDVFVGSLSPSMVNYTQLMVLTFSQSNTVAEYLNTLEQSVHITDKLSSFQILGIGILKHEIAFVQTDLKSYNNFISHPTASIKYLSPPILTDSTSVAVHFSNIRPDRFPGGGSLELYDSVPDAAFSTSGIQSVGIGGNYQSWVTTNLTYGIVVYIGNVSFEGGGFVTVSPSTTVGYVWAYQEYGKGAYTTLGGVGSNTGVTWDGFGVLGLYVDVETVAFTHSVGPLTEYVSAALGPYQDSPCTLEF